MSHFCSSILVIDPEANSNGLITMLGNQQYDVQHVRDADAARARLDQEVFDLILTELKLPDRQGMSLIHFLLEQTSDIPLIILTGHPDIQTAMESVRLPISAYLCKPIKPNRLVKEVKRALERPAGSHDPEKKERPPLEAETPQGEIIGQSPAIKHFRRSLEMIAPTDMTVLIQGESGTGKDIAARLIHRMSWRSGKGNFCKVNCPAVPEALLESELFGHEQGAFTGAIRRKIGRSEQAEGGTLFLDEIGEISPATQAKLLQFIEYKEFTRVGGSRTLSVDARIIAATNQPLLDLVRQGRFRADLYYRLSEFTLTMPSLCSRISDLPLLIRHFVDLHDRNQGLKRQPIDEHLIEMMQAYDWPGNVRELESLVKRYLLFGRNEVLHDYLGRRRTANPEPPRRIDQVEKEAITSTLDETNWNRREAARILGMSYNTLRRRIESYQIRPPINREMLME